MKGEVLLEISGLGKKFSKSYKKSLIYGFFEIISQFFLFSFFKKTNLRDSEFWALKNISFTLSRGECLGLIGANGSGKSTLLKIITGIIKEDKGVLSISGRIGAIIELGAGFNALLTGRENIYNNGAILGFSKHEIDNLFDSIVQFAEIEEFIDSPVQNYSSGMRVRLGFAIASKLNPDILIIDEVLAVGDAAFRAKCYESLYNLMPSTAIIVVSHNMAQIARICNKVLLIQGGEINYIGTPQIGINNYYGLARQFVPQAIVDRVELRTILINGKETEIEINYLSNVKIHLKFLSKEIIVAPCVNIHIIDIEHQYVYQTNNCNISSTIKDFKVGDNDLFFELQELQLNPGRYSFSIALRDSKDIQFLSWYHGIAPFSVLGNFIGVSAYQGKSIWSK